MVHQRQRLALGLEPGNDLFGVHAQLDDLEGHPPLHRLLLLGHIDHPAAALADLLQQLVPADPVAKFFGHSLGARGDGTGLSGHCCWRASKELARIVVCLEKGGNSV